MSITPPTTPYSRSTSSDEALTASPSAIQCGVKRKIAFENEVEIATKRLRDEPDTKSDTVCDECRRIDFQKVLDLENDIKALQKATRGSLIASLGARCNEVPRNGCRLCDNFFRSRADSASEYELRAYSYLKYSQQFDYRHCHLELRTRDIPQLGVVPCHRTKLLEGRALRTCVDQKTSLFLIRPESARNAVLCPRIIGTCADLDLCREWIQYYRKHHRNRCSTRKIPPDGLKLIDCTRVHPTIVPATAACQFATLSYVWGEDHRQIIRSEFKTDFTEHLPITIHDAIVVCRSISISFLWVDRYCIDQANAEEVHRQVNAMDSIYENSDLTLNAATGSNAEAGLSGISSKRQSQRTARLEEFELILNNHGRHAKIQSSPWYSRAWTLQEGFLSRRRLVFTDTQM